MKMSKKTVAAMLVAVSITTEAFIYNSSITHKAVSKTDFTSVSTYPLYVTEETVNWQSSSTVTPVVLKEEVKQLLKPTPTPEIKKSTPKTIKKKSGTTIASRGGTSTKSKTTTTKTFKTVKTAKTTTTSRTVGAYNVSVSEKDLFYRLVSAEASAESFEGKLAVATVIMNRVKSPDYPNTIKGVIYDDNWGVQFTPVSDGRINEPATAESKRAVDKVLQGYRSFGPNIMFFLNPDKSINNYIIKNRTYYKTIGKHDFYY